MPHPSPRTNPSAAASKVRQRPPGDSIFASSSSRVTSGIRMAFTPPASARSASPRWSPTAAWCMATSDDEHAVSTAIAGPSSPRVKAIRPMAMEELFPVAKWNPRRASPSGRPTTWR